MVTLNRCPPNDNHMIHDRKIYLLLGLAFLEGERLEMGIKSPELGYHRSNQFTTIFPIIFFAPTTLSPIYLDLFQR